MDTMYRYKRRDLALSSNILMRFYHTESTVTVNHADWGSLEQYRVVGIATRYQGTPTNTVRFIIIDPITNVLPLGIPLLFYCMPAGPSQI